jgi:hypothetical protein
MTVLTKMNHYLYKPSDNTLEIEQKLRTFDYSLNLERMTCYVFDNEMRCTYTTRAQMKQPTPLAAIFPRELYEFLKTLLQNTFTKTQMVHVKLNDAHVLYSTCQLLDHKNTIIGLILYEVPFTNVQSLENMIDKDMKGIETKYLLDSTGVIFAIEKLNWDKAVLKKSLRFPALFKNRWIERFKSDNILHKSFRLLMDAEKERTHHSLLLKHVVENMCHPVRFCRFQDTNDTEMLVMTTFSRFVNSAIYVLVSNEIIEERVLSANNAKWLNAVMDSGRSVERDDAMSPSCDVCVYCKRMRQAVDEHQLKNYKNNVVYYHEHLPPLYDEELDVPIFGKRGKSGQQSFRILEKRTNNNFCVWLDFRQWQLFNRVSNIDVAIRQTYNHTVCCLCCSEWDYFLSSLKPIMS